MRNDRLRVLQIGKYYPPYRGGIESHLETLCQELRDQVDLRVIVSHDRWKTVQEVVDGVEIVRVGTFGRVASTPVSPGIVSWIRRSPADIVHLHLPNPTGVLAYLLSGHRGKLVMTYHSDVVRQRLLMPAYDAILGLALRRCSALIATSPDYVQSSPVLSSNSKRCSVIPFGIRRDAFRECNVPAVQSIRERFGSRLVLGVGRHVYYKGFHVLIRAMRDVNATLLLIGDGPLRAALEAEAAAAGVRNRIHFLGDVADVVPYYKAADVFVLPSIARSEAFGIVQLEAMACGAPVINTRIPSGVPFVSVHEQTGLTVPPGDAPAMAAAIARLLNANPLRSGYGRAAQARVEQEFGSERMAERTLSLYRTVVGAVTRPIYEEARVFIGG